MDFETDILSTFVNGDPAIAIDVPPGFLASDEMIVQAGTHELRELRLVEKRRKMTVEAFKELTSPFIKGNAHYRAANSGDRALEYFRRLVESGSWPPK